MTASTLPQTDESNPVTSAWSIRPSEYLETLDLGQGEYIVWNRYVPVPTLLNQMSYNALYGVIDDLSDEELAYCRELFLKKRLAYEGDVDPTKGEFVAKISAYTTDIDSRNNGADGRPNKKYQSFNLTTDPCNVGCSYCMIPKFNDGARDLVQLGRKAPPKKSGLGKAEKLEVLKKLLDQHIQARIEAGDKQLLVGMGGGEMLAQWPLIKGMIEHATTTYPDLEFTWEMNSSLTLLTEEQSKFFAEHKVAISTSIDGYKENHDKHRTYHNGKGTFDDVMAGIELYNKYNTENAISAFQGTIADADEFDPNKMFEFTDSRFGAARMAPNVLRVSEEEGEKQADLMVDLYIAGQEQGFEFHDLIFDHFTSIIRAKERMPFTLFCHAMSNYNGASHVNVNLATMSAGVSCSFVPNSFVSLESVDFDLFHQSIWQSNVEHTRERTLAIEKHCMGCELAGACHGGCVLTGIDANNQINPGGCAYLRRVWRRFVAYLHDRADRIESRSAHAIVYKKPDTASDAPVTSVDP